MRALRRSDCWNRAGGARLSQVLRLGVRQGRRKDPPWSSHSQVKPTFPDSPTIKSPVSKGICTTYGKHWICAHQTDPWQLVPPSPCTKVAAPADKDGDHWVSFHYQIDIISLPTKKSTQCLFIISQPIETMLRKSACLDEDPFSSWVARIWRRDSDLCHW